MGLALHANLRDITDWQLPVARLHSAAGADTGRDDVPTHGYARTVCGENADFEARRNYFTC